MSKRNKIIYWIATIWLSLGMLSSGIVQLLQVDGEIEFIIRLGYPAYFLVILGTWKILGVITILLPRLLLLKEWAYAGFFFATSGALLSHFVMRSAPADFFGASLLLLLVAVSWYFRPPGRKIISANFNK